MPSQLSTIRPPGRPALPCVLSCLSSGLAQVRAGTRGSDSDSRARTLRAVSGRKGFALTSALAVVAALAVVPSAAHAGSDAQGAASYDLLVGTYTNTGKSNGIHVYRFDPQSGSASPLSSVQTVNPSFLVVGRGNRIVYAVNELPGDNGASTEHGGVSAFSFDALGKYAYLTSELAATVTVLRYRDGTLETLQTLPLAAPGFKGKQGAAAVHLSPDGRFLYASNRGDANEIVIFAVNSGDGRLTLVGRQSTLGRTPREFAIDPSGHWLVVGNQESDTAYVFRRDSETGKLEPNPARLDIGAPVDFKFTPAS